MRPLTGRELNEQHKAMTESGIDPAYRLAWLRRETDLWRTAASPAPDPAEDGIIWPQPHAERDVQ